MAVEPHRIDFEEFAAHLTEVFERIKDQNQTVLVERDGETYRLELREPEDMWTGYDAAKAREGFYRAIGALASVDRDELLADIHAQRSQDSGGRPA